MATSGSGRICITEGLTPSSGTAQTTLTCWGGTCDISP